MLKWTLTFLVVAIIAGVLGFSSIAISAAVISEREKNKELTSPRVLSC